MLFRKGYLTVVVATGTLAMGGINMPCKIVVFTGDSIYLTALNYRQASGRAGRRGFDVLGNIVFHEVCAGFCPSLGPAKRRGMALDLVLVLSHLFVRIPYTPRSRSSDLHRSSSSATTRKPSPESAPTPAPTRCNTLPTCQTTRSL
ncbi:hypothetical protein B0T14DRAFT_225802 [Immersiella caudata]|uniref:Helicase C-terminal domain-containing protein n=1 Tax=Immersiella caudata TaxID=314043 RepID=A0AA40C0G5_9PEZI|nr:hypothetical protein B0T14DRAFT_225802 [Immersiella caudata]